LQTAKLNGKRLAGDSKMRPESEREDSYFLLVRQLKRQCKFLWLLAPVGGLVGWKMQKE
jgi:hypothetical protein